MAPIPRAQSQRMSIRLDAEIESSVLRVLNRMEAFWYDLRYCARKLARNPGYTTIALLTLALSIGANTAIFSLLNGLILRGLPVRDPDRLVAIYRIARNGQEQGFLLSNMKEVERRQQVFSGMFGWWGNVVFTIQSDSLLSVGLTDAVTGDYYSLLGVRPLLGRLIEPSDEVGGEMVAVISYSLWRERYAGDKNVIGKTIHLQGLPFTIVGVTPKDFFGMEVGTSADVTVPLIKVPQILAADNKTASDSQHIRMNYAVAQLRPGVTIEQARTQLQTIWSDVLAVTVPGSLTPPRRADYLAMRVGVKSAANGFSFLRDRFAKPLYVLMVISGLILLIACVNLASLMLAHAAARGHEFGVRFALGASRSRLFRQLFTESIMLSVTGAVLGLVFAGMASRSLANFMWTGIGRLTLNLQPDARVLGFSTTVAVLTGVLFGVAPAWRATRADPNAVLQQGSQVLGRSTDRLGKSLVIAQVALSLTLLIGAGLFVRSLAKLRAIDPGFQTHGIVEVDLMPMPGADKDFDSVGYYNELTNRLRSLPGVLGVSMSRMPPGAGFKMKDNVATKSASNEGEVTALFDVVTPSFFQTMGLNLFQGRSFTPQDDTHSPRVAVVSKSLARRLFPEGDALGQMIRIGHDPERQNIVIAGIVSDARIQDLHDPLRFAVFVPALQEPKYMNLSIVEVRTAVDPAGLTGAIRQIVESMGRQYPLRIRKVEQVVDASLVQERTIAILAEFFGALALLLAAIGLYGLMACIVGQRTRAIGLRMALGAPRTSVLWMVLREALLLTLMGIAVGLPCALAGTRFIAQMLFGTSPYDLATLATAACTLLAVGAIAGLLPAIRASRLDPMTALRHE